MSMTPRLQKLALLAHITSSVGWLGAVVPYVGLAIAGLTSRDRQTVHAAYVAMRVIGWFVIVPFSLLAFLSGLVQSLGTKWGLFRHWWVIAKTVLTIFAVIVLLQHMRDLNRASLIHGVEGLSSVHLRSELMHSVGGSLVLVVIVAISIFKPWGMTRYGRRQTSRADIVFVPKQPAYSGGSVTVHGRQINWLRVVGYHAIALALLFAILHVAGLHDLHHHLMPR